MWANCKGPHGEEGAFPVFTPTSYYMQDAAIDDSRVKSRKEVLDSLRCLIPSPKGGRRKTQSSPSSLCEALDEEVRAFRRWDGRGYRDGEETREQAPSFYKQEEFVTEWPDLKASEARDDSFHSASHKLRSPPRKEERVSWTGARNSTRKKKDDKFVDLDFNPVAYKVVKKTTTNGSKKKAVSALLSRIEKLEEALQEEGIPIVHLDSNGMPSQPAPDAASSFSRVEKASLPGPAPLEESMNQTDPLSMHSLLDFNNEQDALGFPPISWLGFDHESNGRGMGEKVGNGNQRFDAWEVNQERELFLSKSSPFRLKKRGGAGGNGTAGFGNWGTNPSVGSDQAWFTSDPEFWSPDHVNAGKLL